MTAGVAAGAVAQLILAAVVGWGVGGAIVDRVFPARVRESFGLPERALAAIAGLFVVAVGLMVAHLVTGGAIFGLPGVVPAVCAAVVIAARRHLRVPSGLPWLPVAAAVILLGLIFVSPALAGGSGVRTGDPPWHLGWTEQLLHGDPVPTGPAPELGSNAYPWGWHAVIATLVRLVPGTTPLVAHEALHALLVLAIPLAAACLARAFYRRAGWPAAAASTVGGWAWLGLSRPDFVTTPSEARYGADLVVASPNSAYELFPPALPRELALVLLGAAAICLLHAVRERDRLLQLAAGAAVGLVGLVSVPLFVIAVAWSLATVAVAPSGGRTLRAARLLGPAVAVIALWAAPVVADYVRHGGFVNITPRLGVEWPLDAALWSWGLLLPIAGAGVALVAARRNGAAEKAGLALAAASALLLGLSIARSEFGWDLGGNATLLHQGRMWPPAHLLAAAFAGVALAEVWTRVAPRRREVATAVGAVMLAVGLASPIAASAHLSEVIDERDEGYSYASSRVAPGSFVRRAASHLGPDDVVSVHGSDDLSFLLFQFSGVRLAAYDDPRLNGNDLRIRYRDLAARWDERMATEGFEADFVVVQTEDAPPGAILERGIYAGEDWVLVDV